ncbi:hypothetical protein EJB05_12098, partial [Eragrostis curvula]
MGRGGAWRWRRLWGGDQPRPLWEELDNRLEVGWGSTGSNSKALYFPSVSWFLAVLNRFSNISIWRSSDGDCSLITGGAYAPNHKYQQQLCHVRIESSTPKLKGLFFKVLSMEASSNLPGISAKGPNCLHLSRNKYAKRYNHILRVGHESSCWIDN